MKYDSPDEYPIIVAVLAYKISQLPAVLIERTALGDHYMKICFKLYKQGRSFSLSFYKK